VSDLLPDGAEGVLALAVDATALRAFLTPGD
jgi:hypothetical protein